MLILIIIIIIEELIGAIYRKSLPLHPASPSPQAIIKNQDKIIITITHNCSYIHHVLQ
jgi:hypothetical protein